jgi:hypothetical protein
MVDRVRKSLGGDEAAPSNWIRILTWRDTLRRVPSFRRDAPSFEPAAASPSGLSPELSGQGYAPKDRLQKRLPSSDALWHRSPNDQ